MLVFVFEVFLYILCPVDFFISFIFFSLWIPLSTTLCTFWYATELRWIPFVHMFLFQYTFVSHLKKREGWFSMAFPQ